MFVRGKQYLRKKITKNLCEVKMLLPLLPLAFERLGDTPHSISDSAKWGINTTLNL